MDFRLETFLTVYDTLNYTRAAEQLNITQPAVSQHLSFLERQYECSLFERHGKRIQVTPQGEILYRWARSVQNDEQFLRQLMEQGQETPTPIVIGATLTIGEFIVGKVLADYIHENPHLQIQLRLANTRELMDLLETGQIQLALVEGYFDKARFAYQIFDTRRFIAVCSKEHVFKKQPVYLRDLLEETVIVREEGSGTREILERSLRAKNMEVDDFARKCQITSMHTILELVARDCGITFLYDVAAKPFQEKGLIREIPLKDFVLEHDFTGVWSKDSCYSEAYERFLDRFR